MKKKAAKLYETTIHPSSVVSLEVDPLAVTLAGLPFDLGSGAWVLWNNGRALEVKDVCLEDSFIESQVHRMFPEDRPEMSSVVFMLVNEGLLLPQPKQLGFFTERGFIPGTTSSSKEKSHTRNAMSITTQDGR
ncbi:hypothetical protein EZV62_008520 [Acer yangbiense]|uniref:Uncharacterized protein n=1 Tax=Acer yangbiense TaxID=1000413 RepID=A0A5C7IDX1_9ROSI|nr:hypothetical protein EZV62_008520 [Acer yangbiense]